MKTNASTHSSPAAVVAAAAPAAPAAAAVSPAERRMTRQRRVVLDVVRALLPTHPSADQIYDAVRKRLPRVSLATVYRNLDVLSEQELIRKIGHCDLQMRFDAELDPHFHLRCVECGGLKDAPMAPCARIDEAIRSMNELDVVGYRLEFLYRCELCRSSAAHSKILRPVQE